MKDIVVEVRKGMISGLYCDLEDARFVIVDWDLRERSADGVATEQNHEKLRSLPRDTQMEFDRAIAA